MPVNVELTEDIKFATKHFLNYLNNDNKDDGDGVVDDGSKEMNSRKGKRKPTPAHNRIRGNFECYQCGRCYIRKDSLQRHLTYECGKEPQFQCPFCPQKCKRKAHQIRHIHRQHKDKIGILEENNPDLFIKRERFDEEQDKN